MNLQTAESTAILLLKLNAALDAQIGHLQQVCEAGEFARQRQLFGAAMAGLLDILNPLWLAHPGLLPAQMGGDYVLPPTLLAQAVAELVKNP